MIPVKFFKILFPQIKEEPNIETLIKKGRGRDNCDRKKENEKYSEIKNSLGD